MVPKLLYTAIPGEVTDVDDIDDGPLPEPCTQCGKPASPFVATESGPVCFTCADTDGPDAPDGARAAWRNAPLDRTFWRLVAARLARELVPVPALACRG
jgi:hypothetical protein